MIRADALVVTLTLLTVPSLARAEQTRTEIPSSKAPSQFRLIYHCDDKTNPPSASALGEIKGIEKVTVVGLAGKSVASVKTILPNKDLGEGIDHVTHLDLARGAPCSTAHLAILAPTDSVQIVPLKESADRSAITRVERFLEANGRSERPLDQGYVRSGVPFKRYRIIAVKVFKLSSSYAAVQADVRYDELVHDGQDQRKLGSASEPEPMVFIVGKEIAEVTRDARNDSGICDRIISAFKISNRLQIHVSSTGCNNGMVGQTVFDLSGPEPKAVFSDWDLSN